MKTKLLSSVMALGLVLFLGAPGAQALTPDESEKIRQRLIDWFECEECEEGQLKALIAYGQAAVPSLSATLQYGLSPANREFMRDELARRYDKLVAYQKTHPKVRIASTRDEFVAMYLDNFDAQYRVRAAQALGVIGGEDAKKALYEASRSAKRADVRASAEQALKAASAR